MPRRQVLSESTKAARLPKGFRNMNIYTKSGDGGFSTLSSPMKISKADERFESLGTLDELTSHLGLCKAASTCDHLTASLFRIQKTLITLMSGIAYPNDKNYDVPDPEIEFLEGEIDRTEGTFEREKTFVLPGGCELSARLDVARTVCRRAERTLAVTAKRYPIHPNFRIYVNRLSDYLYIAARKADFDNGRKQSGSVFAGGKEEAKKETFSAGAAAEKIAREIGKGEISDMGKDVTLQQAKLLSEGVRRFAAEKGMKIVVAVANSQGRPVSVEVMDGAFLVSYEVAAKKAYTSVAVKMSTAKLQEEVEKGNSLYGLQTVDQLIYLGGGEPLVLNGQIVGGVGVSGGTAAEDTDLGAFAARLFTELFDKQS